MQVHFHARWTEAHVITFIIIYNLFHNTAFLGNVEYLRECSIFSFFTTLATNAQHVVQFYQVYQQFGRQPAQPFDQVSFLIRPSAVKMATASGPHQMLIHSVILTAIDTQWY